MESTLTKTLTTTATTTTTTILFLLHFRRLINHRPPLSSPSYLLSNRRISSSANLTSLYSPFSPIRLVRHSAVNHPCCYGSFAAGGGGGCGFGFGGGGGGGDGERGVPKVGGGGDVPMVSPDAIVLDVEGMTCGGCAAKVKKILENQPQVSSATVNLATETAIVWPVTEAMVVANWRKELGEMLAKHLTNCGFDTNARGEGGYEGDISV